MPDVSIHITGVDAVIRKLGSVKGVAMLEKPMQESLYKIQSDMQAYPAQPSGTKYIRTGTLGRRWTTRIDRASSGLHGSVGNNTSYAPWVQSQRFQATVHRGRWQTDQQVVDRLRPWIERRFSQAIDRALNGR